MSSVHEPVAAIVIGVGNSWGGDDAVGLRVIERLRDRVPAGVALAQHEGEPTTLLDLWEGARAAIVVDAVSAGGEPGEVSRYDASERALPSSFTGGSTHAFSVAQAIELGRTLGRLPERVVVVGVEGAHFGSGTSISESTARGVEPAARAVLDALAGG
jgi:hydrogenase maturation protease